MQHILTNTEVSQFIHSRPYAEKARTQANVFANFFKWCATQESNRFLWLALAYFASIGLALPATAFSIVFLGSNNFTLWIIACIVNVPVLAVNLAAQPTKITLPIMFFSWAVDAVLILYCAAIFLLQ